MSISHKSGNPKHPALRAIWQWSESNQLVAESTDRALYVLFLALHMLGVRGFLSHTTQTQ